MKRKILSINHQGYYRLSHIKLLKITEILTCFNALLLFGSVLVCNSE